MRNDYIEKYKKLICPNIEKYLVPTLNTTREQPFWFIGYLTTNINDELVTENTKPITIEHAELYLENDIGRLYHFINNICYNKNMIYESMKYECIVYIIVEGLDAFLLSSFYRAIKYESYDYFMNYSFHNDFDIWSKTKKTFLAKLKGLFIR